MDKNRAVPFGMETIVFPGYATEAGKIPWSAHPKWRGVFLKHLVTGKETDGKFSYHLVRIQKGCEVGDHSHETQWEWNMVASGTGTLVIGDKRIAMGPGLVAVAPPEIPHTVSAGDDELEMLALFMPPLV